MEAIDESHPWDLWSRQVRFLARPSFRTVRVKWSPVSTAQQEFVQGQGNYDAVLRAEQVGPICNDITIPDVGPHIFRYTTSDRETMPRYWMEKLGREVNAFATKVVGVAGDYPQMVISNPILRMNYARMVEYEIFRVIEGRVVLEPTNTTEPMELDITQYQQGVPELVAAELVRDVFSPNHFDEFCCKNYVTLKSGLYTYRIFRRTHDLIQVWDEHRKPFARLCVVFRDPGMPPSDEVVMKYLLAKHDPDTLWQIANRFPAGSNLLEDMP